MIRQYRPQRFRHAEIRGKSVMIGTVPVGTIVIVRGYRKVRVEAWLPRDYAVRVNGRFVSKRIVGGHIAVVRRLDNNQALELSDAWLQDMPEFYSGNLTSKNKRRLDEIRRFSTDVKSAV